jgi:hypothetical protein
MRNSASVADITITAEVEERVIVRGILWPARLSGSWEAVQAAWFCVLALTPRTVARDDRKALTSDSPIKSGWRFP